MATRQFDKTLEEALQLSPTERLEMAQRLIESYRQDVLDTDEQPLAPDEIAELLHVEPLSPTEIVANGLLGTWGNLDIEDGAEWVNERKHRRQERLKW